MNNQYMSLRGKPGARSLRRRISAGCPAGYVWDPLLQACKKGKAPVGKYPPGTCAPGYVWDPVLGICKSGKEPSLGPIRRLQAQRARAHQRGVASLIARGIRPGS